MDLVKIIHDAIDFNSFPEHREYIGASSIGHPCSRSIWYGYKGYSSSAINPTLKITFEIGHRLESMLIDYMKLANLRVERPGIENNELLLKDEEYPNFQGHCDAILHLDTDNSAVVEIKTAKNQRFTVFKEKGLRAFSETYYAQLQSYMGMAKLRHGVVLAINKDNSQLHAEWVNFDEQFYLSLRDKAKMIAEALQPPPRINSSPVFLLCNQCQYKTICHVRERNDRVSN